MIHRDVEQMNQSASCEFEGEHLRLCIILDYPYIQGLIYHTSILELLRDTSNTVFEFEIVVCL